MRTTIAVLRGGPSIHADLSLKSGGAVLRALDPDRHEARGIFISPDGYWYREGNPMQPERALRGAHLVINCIPGRYGQDGWLHQLIAKMGHRILGSSAGPLALSFNKEKAKLVALRLGLNVPSHRSVSRDDNLDAVALAAFRTFPMPAEVSPLGGSFLHAPTIAIDVPTLHSGLQFALSQAKRALIEEQIKGSPVSIAIVESFADESKYAIPLSAASPTEAALAIDAAQKMHQHLGLSHFSQSDFILNDRGLWYRHTNALPPLHQESSFVCGLASREIALPEFLDHVIGLSCGNK